MQVISIESVSPNTFTTPGNYQTQTASVVDPTLTLAGLQLGKDLQSGIQVYLSAPAPAAGLTLVITSGDSNRVKLSADPAVLGGESVSFTLASGDFLTPLFYVQALDGSGTVQLTASAANYQGATNTVTLQPSGFVVQNPYHPNDPTASVQASGPDQPLTVSPAMLTSDGVLNFVLVQALRPGVGPVSAAVQSDDLGVGTIVTSPVVFNANDGSLTTSFHPVAAGTTEVRIVTPSGFSTPSNFQHVTATVSP